MSRLFHTLVVFGAGVSLPGCGGRAVGSEGTVDLGDGGNGNGGAAPEGAGGRPGTGGRAQGSGGSLVLGGAPGAGGVPFDPGVSTQWNCIDYFGSCTSVTPSVQRFFLGEPCPVDPSRPKSAADCAPDEWFECYLAAFRDTLLLVNCQCAPMAADPNCVTCSDVPGSDFGAEPVSCGGRTKTCGCVYTGILR